jgi:hypothetical protein
MTTCHHQYGEMTVFLDGPFQHASTLKVWASLIHYNEVKALGLQAAQALLIRLAGPDKITLTLKNCSVKVQVCRFLIYYEHSTRRSKAALP